MKSPMYIAMIGNLSAGYHPVGPFDTLSEAADFFDGADVWIMEVTHPETLAKAADLNIPVIGRLRENGQVEIRRVSDA